MNEERLCTQSGKRGNGPHYAAPGSDFCRQHNPEAPGRVEHSAPPEYGGERTVAARFGLSADTLRTLRYRGGGPPYRKLGRRVLYRLSEVREWIESHRVDPEGAP